MPELAAPAGRSPGSRFFVLGGCRRSAATCLALLVSLAGCADEPDGPLDATAELAGGDARLVAHTAPLRLALLRGDEELLAFEADGFQLGLVTSADDEDNYDPYRLYVPHVMYQPPVDLVWAAPLSASLGEVGDGELGLSLHYADGIEATLRAEVDGQGRFSLSLTPTGNRTAYLRLRAAVDETEGFYGLGESFDSVDHRGKVRAMQLELDTELEGASNEAHVPIPFVLGTTGWGLFVRSPYPGSFAMAHEQADRMEASFGTGPASSEGLSFYLFAEDHPLDLTAHYYELTGAPGLPARWALGPWVWRDENDDQAQVESDLNTMRDLDLAATGYWIDRPYATAVNTFDFEPGQFPDPAAMIQIMHDLGFRTALWHTPYLDESSSATADLRATAEAEGYYPLESGLSLNSWGTPLDLTNPEAVAWWRSLLEAYTSLGVEGFKLDYAEDVSVGLTLGRMPWRFADGSDERTMHGGYQRAYHETYAPLLPEDGGFLLCRAATYGEQQSGLIIWPGDLDSTFAEHREPAEDDGESYLSVGGLPAAVIAGQSLGPSGFAFFGSDTGGYRHCPPDKELFTRWFEHSALTPVMQVGTSCNDVAWEFSAESGFDQEMLDWYRTYARLHLRLFPFWWSYANRLLDDGRPIQRALGLAHPELGVHPDDVYLLGAELLVAPVVQRGVTERTVPLPEGTWVHWWTGQVFQGPDEPSIAAPLGRIPLFLRAGAMVPLLRPTIDTLVGTADPARVDSYATTPGVLYVRAVYGHEGSFVLFDGGEVSQRIEDDGVQVSVADGAELAFGAVFELLGAPAPQGVSAAGQPLDELSDLASLEAADAGYVHDPALGGTLWIKLPGGGAQAHVVAP